MAPLPGCAHSADSSQSHPSPSATAASRWSVTRRPPCSRSLPARPTRDRTPMLDASASHAANGGIGTPQGTLLPTRLRLLASMGLGQSGGMPSPRAEIARLRQVALAALGRYPLPERTTHVRHPRREHHVPARQRGWPAPGQGAPAAPARPRRGLRGRHPLRARLAAGPPDGHRSGRAGAAGGPGRRLGCRGVRGRRDADLLGAALDGRAHPRGVRSPGPPPSPR